MTPVEQRYQQLPIGFFDQQVLASYRAEPDKWTLQSDNFEGLLKTTPAYYETLDEQQREDQYISIRFGFRTLASGDLAIVAWLPGLCKRSRSHFARWQGFSLQNPSWIEPDPRFDLWIRRYIGGDWSVENGVLFQLADCVATIRALTTEVLGAPIFKNDIPSTLCFPAAENSHRYQDAHRELYGYLIDGLDKNVIATLAGRLGLGLNLSSDRTVSALKKVLPTTGVLESFWQACDLVSEQRRLAAHSVRPAAVRFGAFEAFSRDLELCVDGCRKLLLVLERHCDAEGASARSRQEALARLPQIVQPAEPGYSICQAKNMVGKTVRAVEFGFREDIPGVHGSEVLICRFTDGSVLAIDTGSNASNISATHRDLSPEDFTVDLDLHWVPPLKKPRQGSPNRGVQTDSPCTTLTP